jgi:predicted RNA-binding Zn-ribbon protein involved in translation (DUF1610 family)
MTYFLLNCLTHHTNQINKTMGLKTQCDACGDIVLGITDSLQEIDGRYYCSSCATKLRKPNMALCPDCGQVISARAAACPKCGAPQSNATAA